MNDLTGDSYPTTRKMSDSNEIKIEGLLDIINSSARQAVAEYKKTGHGVPGIDSSAFHPLDLATDTLALRKAIRLLEGACDQLNAILAPPQHSVYNFVHNYNWACTSVAVRSRIVDVLDKYPDGLSVDKLADAVNLDKTNLARVLRALSLKGCFKEVKRDVFANTRLSLILKSSSDAGCCVQIHQEIPKYGVVLYESMVDKEFARSEGVDGAPRVFACRKDGSEEDFWKMLKADEERRIIFQRGMMGHTEVFGSSALLHHYPWDSVSSVVDIASGTGAISIPLTKMFPHLKITNQDLPEILVQAQHAWETKAPEALVEGRVELVPFNFFEESPVVGKDVYYLRNILHDWPDADCTTILRSIRKAMESNSRVLIHDCVLAHTFQEPDAGVDGLSTAPDPMLPNFGAGSHSTYQQDMTMWFSHNGKERTLDEVKIIGASAGLALTRVYDLVGTMVMEFRIAQD
ncbi:O-methyltransferase-domain-containing protein [Suillus clintonianus]|uniref:O-methyltransferase-domain-containing protein n=1 Tax=Suillus clintonianus TaxID=1904413 RepID=UPI001B87C6B1|nr:O-methyltransferase-domain-containing protein [Suillus clintonianus]KAG2124435.1 O-methyltransferase-domain-containing protein [Suillus clintonianus]